MSWVKYVNCWKLLFGQPAALKLNLWGSETIQKWSKLQAQLKSIPIDIQSIHPRTLNSLLDKELSNEDIVRTLTKVKERMKKRHSRN